MARSHLFKRTMGLLRAAIHAEQQGWSDRQLLSNVERQREERLFSRRDVLRTAAQAGVALPLSGLLWRNAGAAEKPVSLKRRTNADPVVIIGGGVAGLVAAYRLQQAGIPVELYEGSSRLGGRVFTKDKFNADGMFCELGGELIDSGHKDVLDLCKELNLPIENTLPYDAGVEQDLFHFGGKIYTQTEMLPAFRPLARHLARDIKAVFPDGNTFMPTYDRQGHSPETTRKFDAQSLGAYLDSTKKDVDKWVLDTVEVEYVCEYGMDSAEQSALNLLILIEPDQAPGKFNLLGDSDESLRVRGGNSRLVEALEARVRHHAPRVHLKHKLTRVEDRSGKVVLTFDADGSKKTVSAARVICAIPFATLRNVEGVAELGLSPLKKKCIAELGYGVNTKFMMGFRDRYWRKKGTAAASRANLLTDAIDQQFWETSKGQKGKSGIITNYLGGSRTRDGRTIAERRQSVLTEFEKLYPGMKAGHDDNIALFQWGEYPLAFGSYVSPHPNQYTTLWGAASVPELDGRLHFAGEHASVDGAGFINGAVNSGNQVAAQILGQTVTSGRREHSS